MAVSFGLHMVVMQCLYCVARTGSSGARGVSAFIVSKDTPGLSFGKKEEDGITSFTNGGDVAGKCCDSRESLVAKGQGFMWRCRHWIWRITIAASAPLAQATLEESTEYACIRKQFKQPIINFQGVGFMLADMAIQIEQSRLLVHRAAIKDGSAIYTDCFDGQMLGYGYCNEGYN